ncbi:diadenylate cyclase CdaA [Clostridium hydrogeniformans]|uniref:diadenylate cyclase CdaA n=1 Tax=Clostridium hydrogeniformans TaxID=349933 RepID=UPI0004885BF5|nr:diadenylate cyclase CdaA [Clostridium hydrogeniformans]
MEIWEVILNTVKNISIPSVLDILVVAYIFYKGYMLIRETRAEQLLKGILFILALIPISYLLELRVVYTILSKTITIGVLSIIIIFQPEIRRALEHLGRSTFIDRHILDNEEVIEKVMSEIVIAVDNLSQSKTGALIAIEQNTGLGEIIATGTNIDAVVSSALLENIFVVNTPLHDGSTIIRNDRIVSSGCVLPLTSNNTISKKLGTRHRAAMGLSETSDALVIIVSEETGTISLAVNGRLKRNFARDELKFELLKLMKNRKDLRKLTAGERVKKWIIRRKNKTS